MVLALVAAAVIVLVVFVANNPDVLHRLTGHGFKVGDCATVEPDGIAGNKMMHADCTNPTTSNNLFDPVYRVDQVKDAKNAICYGGFGGVTFSNEPEDTTYCLSPIGAP